jgi:hypothetical protein
MAEQEKTVTDLLRDKSKPANKQTTAVIGDVVAGREFGKEVLGEGLGRMKDDQDIKRVLERRREMAEGPTGEAAQRRLDTAKSGLRREQELARRQLLKSQAASGMRGATAGAQQGAQALMAAQQQSDLENRMAEGEEQREIQALGALETSAGAATQFDLAQAAKEKNIELSSGLGFAQMGAANRAADKAAQANIAAAAAGRPRGKCFPADTQILMNDGQTKRICDIKLGERVFGGGEVYSIMQNLYDGNMYNYKGVGVVGSHAVLEDGKWIRVEDSSVSFLVEFIEPYTYNLCVEGHELIINGITFADYDEIGYGGDYNNIEGLRELNARKIL